ncbi:MAG: hypothetical protein R3B96_06065 [Pirellulaceae bacterium]
MLFAVWIFVLNHKIQHGPESVAELAAHKERLWRGGMTQLLRDQGVRSAAACWMRSRAS